MKALLPMVAVTALLAGACERQPTTICTHTLELPVTVTPAARTLYVGDTTTFRASIPRQEPCPGEQPAPPSNRFLWSAQNPAVASVIATSDSTARVTALALGQTAVIAAWAEQPTFQAAGLLTVTAAGGPTR